MTSKEKILSWRRLAKAIKQERYNGKTIVFTNGCFDLVHVGHIKVFEWCKKHGDVLIVGLNDDASVRRLKGPQRPIVNQRERAYLLACFNIIDYVTLFSGDTPEKLIRLVKPDVLVKGGDWTTSKIVGADIARKVVRVPLVKGKSTSALIERIVRLYGHCKTSN